jgi:putative SOS response-associated peptidase YedK
MCGRTSLFVPPSALEERFDVDVPSSLEPRYNIAPRDDLAVVRNDDPDRVRLEEWGLVPGWADDPESTRFINARAETIEETASFREPVARRRCLVLSDGFYEWQERTSGKQPYRVEREDGDPFAMAGIWEEWSGDDRSLTTVAVVTTEPNEVVAPLHDRMAVVLDADEERAWLDADDPDERTALLDTPDPDPFHAYPVSAAVNDPSNDSPAVVEAADVPDEDPQTGLDDF